MKRSAQLLLLSVFFSAYLGLHWISIPTVLSENFPVGSSGTIDLSAYWSAFALNQEGRNPYNPLELHAKQASIGLPANSTMMVWNPPWSFFLLQPILSHAPSDAAALWFLLNAAFLFASLILLSHLYSLSTSTRFALFVCGLCSFPAYSTVVLGQLSIMLCFALVLFAFSIRKQAKLIGVFALLFLTIKPHLVFLVWAYLLADIWHRKNHSLGLLFCCFFTGLLGVLAWHEPQLFQQWLGVYENFAPQKGAYSIYAWRSPTLTSELREFLVTFSKTASRSVMWGIPGMAFLATMLLALKNATVNWEKDLPLLILLSSLFSPFGWVFDQTLLLLPVAALLGKKPQAAWLIALLLALHLVYFLVASNLPNALPYLYCYPLAIALLWFWNSGKAQKVSNLPDTN